MLEFLWSVLSKILVLLRSHGWRLLPGRTCVHPVKWHPNKLPRAGEIVRGDFRTASTRSVELSPEGVRVLCWNIERGLQLTQIIRELTSLSPAPDVLVLQELDLGCARTGCENVAAVIAQALHMQYLFVVEFEELASPLRTPVDRGGVGQGGGVHGNAILTRFDFAQIKRHPHELRCTEPSEEDDSQDHTSSDPDDPYASAEDEVTVNDIWSFQHELMLFPWHTQGVRFGEPRKGRRVCVGAAIQLPATRPAGLGLPDILEVYSVHLENNSGMLGRCMQFNEILQHMAYRETNRDQQQAVARVVAGDFNTLINGRTRVIPAYWDVLSWFTLWAPAYVPVAGGRLCSAACARSETAFWQHHILHKPESELWRPPFFAESWVRWSSALKAYRRDFMPNRSGLRDVFDKQHGVTVAHHGFAAKLDWVLVEDSIKVRNAAQGGKDFSDHQWLAVSLG